MAIDSIQLARASEYLSLVATAAAEGGIGVDVFCAGSSELGWPVYQSIVDPSGGYVLMHDTFASEQLRRNLTRVVQQTHLSLAQLVPDHDPDDEENRANPAVSTTTTTGKTPMSEEVWVEGCTVDIRMSRFVLFRY